MFGIGVPELMVILLVGAIWVVGIGGTILWIWMLIDCATKEPDQGKEKVMWVMIIALTHWIGALLYLTIRRPRRLALYGA